MNVRRAAFVAVAAASTGCVAVYGFDGFDTERPPLVGEEASVPAVSTALAIVPPSGIVLRRGASGTVPVTIARGANTADVVLAAADVPAGIGIAPVSIAAGKTTAELVVVAADDAPFGASTITLRCGDARAPLVVSVAGATLDPTFGDGGIVVGADGERLEDWTVDSRGKSLVAAVADNGVYVAYRDDARGSFHRATFGVRPNADIALRVGRVGDEVLLAQTIDMLTSLTAYVQDDSSWGFDTGNATIDSPVLAPTPDGSVLLVDVEEPRETHTSLVTRVLDPADGGLRATELLYATSGDVVVRGAAGEARTYVAVNGASPFALGIDANGKLDRNFADAGFLSWDAPPHSEVRDIGYGNRRLVILAADATLREYDGDGARDDTFADGGVAHLFGTPNGFTIDERGRFLVATDFEDGGAAVVAYRSSGAFDPTLGTAGGAIALPFGDSVDARIVRVAPDGRIFVAGEVQVGKRETWFVARYVP